jgi:hypothetical protein
MIDFGPGYLPEFFHFQHAVCSEKIAWKSKKLTVGMAQKSKSTLLESAVWEDDSEGVGGTLYFPGKRRLNIPDHDLWTGWKGDPEKLVPGYILDRIRQDEGKEVKLCSVMERYKEGENFVIEHIEKEGAMILVTSRGETNLALLVEGNYVTAFKNDKYVMMTVEREQDTQYVKHFPKDMLKNMLYPHTPAGHTRSIGQRAQYNKVNADADSIRFSHNIAERLCMVKEIHQDRVKNLHQCALTMEHDMIEMLSVGSGFQTEGGLGIVLRIDSSGRIAQWRELWDQNYFNRNYPGILQAMRGFYVFETDLVHIDAVNHKDISRVFQLKPIALAQQRDMFGEGAKFIVGKVEASNGEPIQIYGLNALNGEQLLNSLYCEAALCNKVQIGAYVDPLKAAIEDGLRYIADYKPESSRKPPSPIDLHMIPGDICMALLRKFTSHLDRKAVIYDENHLSVQYHDDWRGLEPIMKRNAHRTIVPNSGVVVAGAAKFKWMLLPYSKLVVSLRYYKLLTPGETASHLDTSGTKSREFDTKLTDKTVCRQCLRRFGTGCKCHD